ncbi:hypothetical protein NW768_008000 [Fusarium equiseti]|uniref:Heterokaryon incompatibility domain-containing protein n=1 Tax=Fusarium equiseti TaxID=61235 RepID=A0ABQ8R5I1_FUSEQ|nr:hypothetical protein NW768_008000 [Fusarium equiseti]
MMWIDQICINQDDKFEKAQQIPLMSKIYTLATSTVIWLGEAGEESNLALKLLEQIISSLQFTFSNPDFAALERLGLPTADSKDWESLCKLLTRPWFGRVWIIQEAVLSSGTSLWFACGDRFIPWTTLTGACIYLETCGISRKLGDKFPTIIPENAPLGNAISNIEAMKIDAFPQLFDFLTKTRTAECFNPKDRVYGLVGLLDEKDKAAVRISYESDYTVASLYRDVTVDYIRSEPNPWMRLSLVLEAADHESSELPSWAPDWREHPSTVGLNTPLSFSGAYNACGRFSHIKNRGKPMAEIIGNELTTPGVFFDTIIRVADKFVDPDLSYQSPTTENTALLNAVAFTTQLQENGPYGRYIFDAVWKTLVAGKYDKGPPKLGKRKASSEPPEPPYAEIFSFLFDETTGKSPSLPGQTYSRRQKSPQGQGRIELSSLGQRTLGQTFQEARSALRNALRGRRLGITSKGYFGLFPRRAAVGDVLYVLDRCPLPYVLRSVGSEGKFKFIGECFVHGIMNGEAVEPEDICLEGVTLV